MRPDYYELLQVSPNASVAVIRAAYRRLMRDTHTDLRPSMDAAERAKLLGEAVAVLTHPDRRREYDEWQQQQAQAASRDSPTPTEEEGPEIILLKPEVAGTPPYQTPAPTAPLTITSQDLDAEELPPLSEDFSGLHIADRHTWRKVNARCQASKQLFAVWFEPMAEGEWQVVHVDTLPPEAEKSASRESSLELVGRFYRGRYEKCPYCGQESFYQCGECRGIACSGHQGVRVVCPWCGHRGIVHGYIDRIDVKKDPHR